MLPGKNRFHSRGGVRFVYAHGMSKRSPRVSINYLINTRRKNSRFAVVVSKKVLKGAVGRNRIRRRIYEVIRHELPKMVEPVDVIVTVYTKDLRELPSKELIEIVRQLFREAGLYEV